MKRSTVLLVVIALLLAATLPSFAQPPADDGKGPLRLKVFVHYPREARGGPKPKPTPPPGECDPTENDQVEDYGLTGWKLSDTVTYHVNYTSVPATVVNAGTAIANSFQVWEDEAGGAVDFVQGDSTSVKVSKRDGLNVVIWGRVSASNAIAVSYTWYYASTGEVVEQDIVLNVKLPWSYTSDLNPDAVCGDLYSYDVQNILTHEVGHWMGLDDLYEDWQQDLTMYGYGDKGELKKDTLGRGDELGVAALY